MIKATAIGNNVAQQLIFLRELRVRDGYSRRRPEPVDALPRFKLKEQAVQRMPLHGGLQYLTIDVEGELALALGKVSKDHHYFSIGIFKR